MIEINIPGFKMLKIENLVLDFNGTMAVDGVLLPTVKNRLKQLSEILDIYVISSDTFGTVEEQCRDLPLEIRKIGPEKQREQKGEFIRSIDGDKTCAIGNGDVDEFMLKESILSIAIFGHEACSRGALLNSDLYVVDIDHALDLLLKPRRIVATLRR